MSKLTAKTFLMQVHAEPGDGFSIHKVIVGNLSYSAWFNEAGVCTRAVRSTPGEDGKAILADTPTTRALSAVGRGIHAKRRGS